MNAAVPTPSELPRSIPASASAPGFLRATPRRRLRYVPAHQRPRAKLECRPVKVTARPAAPAEPRSHGLLFGAVLLLALATTITPMLVSASRRAAWDPAPAVEVVTDRSAIETPPVTPAAPTVVPAAASPGAAAPTRGPRRVRPRIDDGDEPDALERAPLTRIDGPPPNPFE